MNFLFFMKPILRTHFFGRIILIVLLALLTVGCFAPALVMENNAGCQLVTKKLELVVSEKGTHTLIEDSLKGMLNSSECQTPECLLLVPLGIFAISVTSMIVSGSIVVVGNTIHWVEKQGKCENSLTQSIINNVTNSIHYFDGVIIQSSNDLIQWFKQHLGIESQE